MYWILKAKAFIMLLNVNEVIRDREECAPDHRSMSKEKDCTAREALKDLISQLTYTV